MTKYINLVLTNFNNIMILGTDKMLGIILGVLVLPVSLQDACMCQKGCFCMWRVYFSTSFNDLFFTLCTLLYFTLLWLLPFEDIRFYFHEILCPAFSNRFDHRCLLWFLRYNGPQGNQNGAMPKYCNFCVKMLELIKMSSLQLVDIVWRTGYIVVCELYKLEISIICLLMSQISIQLNGKTPHIVKM